LRRLTCAVLAGLVLSSCGTRETAGAGRFGLLPSENLSGDPSLDWVSTAIPVLLASQLEGLPQVSVVRAASRRDAASSGAAAILCRHEGSAERLEVSCWKEDSASVVRATGNLETEALAAIASRLGRALHAGARPALEVSNRALRAYAAKDFLEAVRLDPDFSYAYTDGAGEAMMAGDRATADRLIADGLARGAGIGDLARARLYLVSGTLSRNREDQIAALRQLTSLVPTEPENWRRLSQLLSAGRQFADAAAAQEKLAGLHAGDPAVWNQLAYLRAWAGDTARAVDAASRYERLSPGNANAADTLGDVHYLAGNFAEAEKQYLESMSRDPDLFGGQGYFKAAMARLRAGDAAKAEEHFRQFAERAGPAKELLLAQWRYIATGDAMAEIEQVVKSPSPDVAAAALAQMAVWRRLAGDVEKANAAARQSVTLSRTPLARQAAQTAFFVTLPKADSRGWRERAEKALPGPPLEQARRSLTLVALIAQGEFAEALPLAQQIFDETPAERDYAARIYLAWCLQRTGNAARAAELLRTNPIPPPPVTGPFDAVLLRQELDLRKALAAN
jgi:hypothetical protein